MGRVMFYHHTRSAPAETLAALLPKARGQGWRVMVRGTDPAALDRLDARLWQGAPTDFLPHGREGGPHDAAQPVLIGQGAAVNGAQGLFLLDAAPVTAEEAAPMERVWVLFDAADPAALDLARAQWTMLTRAGLAAQYWSEETGRWQMKLERAGGTGA